ncbi:d-serine/d-alanine/glycine transporter [hydrocarbon metagenome]|uniref:D-serine/d-alanine/glycine transporter n=1 Tax=hydrocarbon metagenome TaxID=938273 RepID=A0A0W8E4S1_9ZZZZ
MNKQDGLSAWQLTMLALGTVVGGSFFLGSAIAINAAGPGILLSFILGGLLVYLILTSLSEMTVADPQPGSFRTYSEQQYGPWLGFMVGWVYWTGLVLAMSSEATAVSLFLQAWIPQFSLPLIAILVVVVVTLLNLLGSRKLSNLESGLAGIKVAALIGFVLLGIALIWGIFPDRSAVGAGVLPSEAFFPAGIGGIAGSMLIVLFSYAGFEIIGLASSEAKDPHTTVRKAIRYTIFTLVGLYVLVIAVMLPLISTSSLTGDVSPLVAALTAHGLGIAANTVNIVLITAILSTMLAATFGLGRMLRSLADTGNAPAFLIDKGDIPLKGILFSGIAMLAGVSMAYLLPSQIYIFLVSSGGFSLLFAYLVILITHYRFRQHKGCPPSGHCQLPGFPYTSWLAIVSIIIIIMTMPLIPGQGSGLLAGLLLLLFYSLSYLFFKAWPLHTRSSFIASAKLLRHIKKDAAQNIDHHKKKHQRK